MNGVEVGPIRKHPRCCRMPQQVRMEARNPRLPLKPVEHRLNGFVSEWLAENAKEEGINSSETRT